MYVGVQEVDPQLLSGARGSKPSHLAADCGGLWSLQLWRPSRDSGVVLRLGLRASQEEKETKRLHRSSMPHPVMESGGEILQVLSHWFSPTDPAHGFSPSARLRLTQPGPGWPALPTWLPGQLEVQSHPRASRAEGTAAWLKQNTRVPVGPKDKRDLPCLGPESQVGDLGEALRCWCQPS